MIAGLKLIILMLLTLVTLAACSYSPSKSEKAAKEQSSSEVTAIFSELQKLVPEMQIAKTPGTSPGVTIGEFSLTGNYVMKDSQIFATLVSDKSGKELCDIFYKYLKQNGWNISDETACKVKKRDNYLHSGVTARIDYSPQSNQSIGIGMCEYLDSRKSALITKKTEIKVSIFRSLDNSKDYACNPELGIERCRYADWWR